MTQEDKNGIFSEFILKLQKQKMFATDYFHKLFQSQISVPATNLLYLFLSPNPKSSVNITCSGPGFTHRKPKALLLTFTLQVYVLIHKNPVVRMISLDC